MSEQEAIAYIEEWDVTEAAKVLKWYEEDELLRPCDCDTIVAIETENLHVDNDRLRELVEDMLSCIEIRAAFDRPPTEEMYETFAQRARELGVEVG